MTTTVNLEEKGSDLYSQYYQVDILRKSLGSIPKQHQTGTHQAVIGAIDPILAHPEAQRWPVLCTTSYHIRAESNLIIASMIQDPDTSRTCIEQAASDFASARNIWMERQDVFNLCQGSLDTIFSLLRSYPDIQQQYQHTFDEIMGNAIHEAILSYEEVYPLLEEERQEALDMFYLAETMRASIPLMDTTGDKKILLKRALELSGEASGRFYLTGDRDLSQKAESLNVQILKEISALLSCPSCHALLSGGAQFCGSCGARLGSLQQQPERTAEMVPCPKCGKPLTPGKKFCGSCGAAFAFSPDLHEVIPVPGTCPQCGEPVNADAKFCRKCGTPTR
jgi:predicted RNA-binding Zn-ribbon protein involved in translation (DUF1610 family)